MKKGGESKFWHEISPQFRKMGTADRIESHATSLGRPDVNLAIPHGIVWDIELKYSDNSLVTLRPSQRGWFKRRLRVGAPCFVFTKAVIDKSDIVYLINTADRIPDQPDIGCWIGASNIMWYDEVNWIQFEEILREKK